jgi:chromosome transmission fidelity protein 4
LELAQDELGDELTSEEIISKERALDKELIQLIQAACKDGNTARALELTKLLHYAQSFDMAMKVADFYHFTGLREKIDTLKQIHEDVDREAVAREKRMRWTRSDLPAKRLPSNDEFSAPRPKAFQDFGPPPAIARPGLMRAIPSVEKTRFSSVTPSSDATTWDEPAITESPPGTKRKLAELELDDPQSSVLATQQPSAHSESPVT